MPWNMKLGLQLLKTHKNNQGDQLDLKMETVRLISSRTHPPKEEELTKRLQRALKRDNEQLGTRRQLSAIVATKKRKNLIQNVSTPTLIIHGTEDRLIPLRFGKKSAALIQNAEFREIEGMAHDFPRPLIGYLAFLVGKHLGKSVEKR